jgi:hypothetical protein
MNPGWVSEFFERQAQEAEQSPPPRRAPGGEDAFPGGGHTAWTSVTTRPSPLLPWTSRRLGPPPTGLSLWATSRSAVKDSNLQP